MELLGLLLLIGLTLATKSMWDSTVRDFQQSKAKRVKEAEGKAAPNPLPKSRRRAAARRHAAGYWAGEIGHGFPVARTGFHAGWLAHRTATDHHKAIREGAKTTQMETRVGFLGDLRAQERRQAEAQKAIDEAIAAAPKPVRGKKAVQEAAGSAVADLDAKRAEKVAGTAPPLPADAVKPAEPAGPRPVDDLAEHLKAPMPDPRLNDAQRQRDAKGWQNLCAACGMPGDVANPLVIAPDGFRVHTSETTDPKSGYYDPAVEGDGMEKSDQELLARAHPADLLILAKRELDRGHLERSKELTEWAKAKRQATADGLPGIPYTSSPATNGEAPVADDDHQGGGQWERDMRATAAEHGYEVIKGGEGYQPPEWAMEEARRSATPDPGPNEGNGNGTSPRATSFTANGAAPVATAEITFDQSIAEAGKLIAEQEHKLAALRASRMGNVVEGLAGAVTDSGSLGRAMDMDESLRAEITACQHTLDSTLAFRGGLIRDHGGLNEAHQSAPVEAADKSFYEG